MEYFSWATPVTTGLSVVLLIGHLTLRLLPDELAPCIFLVPGYTITRPWQVITSGYFDDSLFNVLLTIPVLLYCGHRLRGNWGDRELARFLVLVNLLQACATWSGMILLYIVFRAEHFLFARLGGVTGLLTALSVALKQHPAPRLLPMTDEVPASPAALFASSAMAVASAHAPSLALTWSVLIILLTHAGPPDELLFACNGLLFAWVYLRYYQPRQDGQTGDTSSDFTFARLFPSPLQRPLGIMGSSCFGAISSFGCFPPSGWQSHTGTAPVQPPELPDLTLVPAHAPAVVTTSDPEVAERRRERARLLIEARIGEKLTVGALPLAV